VLHKQRCTSGYHGLTANVGGHFVFFIAEIDERPLLLLLLRGRVPRVIDEYPGTDHGPDGIVWSSDK
jgi:hypothetical protein